MKHTVTVKRTELISFELEADSPEDAEQRYLSDGDEVFSKTIEHDVISVTTD